MFKRIFSKIKGVLSIPSNYFSGNDLSEGITRSYMAYNDDCNRYSRFGAVDVIYEIIKSPKDFTCLRMESIYHREVLCYTFRNTNDLTIAFHTDGELGRRWIVKMDTANTKGELDKVAIEMRSVITGDPRNWIVMPKSRSRM